MSTTEELSLVPSFTNTFVADIATDPLRMVQVEVGDSKQVDFFPQNKMLYWDNECNFSMRLVTLSPGTLQTTDKVVEYVTPEMTARFYSKMDVDDVGGFVSEVEFPSLPASNVLTYTIQFKGLRFSFQPPLTDKEIAEGHVRPDNVAGAYVAWHESKANNAAGGKAYGTGKAFIHYRPEALDAKGNQAWCDLFIDDVNGLMTVTVPQVFLDNATYPVVVR